VIRSIDDLYKALEEEEAEGPRGVEGSRIARSYRIHVYEVDYLCKPSSGISIFINCP